MDIPKIARQESRGNITSTICNVSQYQRVQDNTLLAARRKNGTMGARSSP